MISKVLCFSFLCLTFVSCHYASYSEFGQIQMGMSKWDVLNSFNRDACLVRGCYIDDTGNKIELVEVKVAHSPLDACLSGGVSGEPRDFWVFLKNGIVVKWGKSGDWNTAIPKNVIIDKR